MADNVLQNIGQGLQSFLTGTPLSQIQNQAEQQRIARQQQFMQLDDQRKSAMFQDARTVNSFLKSGQPTQALNVLSNRLSLIERIGGDPSDTMEIANLIAQGDLQGATDLLDSVEQAGVMGGFLKSKDENKGKRVQNSRDVEGGTIITYNDGSQEFKPFGEEVYLAGEQEAQRKLPKLTSALQNKQLEFQESANNAYSLSEKTELLAERFSKIDTATGVRGSARESFLNFIGGQDEISNLRKDFTRIRNKLITANLPQGPATDKDIELIAAGFPESTANQAQIVDFLRAMSRGQEAIARFDEFKSTFLQENGNITRATRNFTFDGQEIKKGERLASAYKRISKNLNPRTKVNEQAAQPQKRSEQDILSQYGIN